MPAVLTDEQQLLQDATRRLIESRTPMPVVRTLHDDPVGFDRDWLRQGAELGWFAMLVDESDGGGNVDGAGVIDATVVAESFGRGALPGPLVPMNVVASALSRSGPDDLKGRYLGAIVSGEAVATWAPFDAAGRWDDGAGVQARASGTVHRLSGARGFVQDGQNADVCLVAAELDGRAAQFLVPADQAAVAVTPLQGLDLSRRFAEVRLDAADGWLLGEPADHAALDRNLQIAVALSTAETVGALDAMVTMTVDYSKDRIAFGRPIGSFQALKHIMADISLWLETARAGAEELAEAVRDDLDDLMEITHMVAAYIGDVATDIAQECLQIHGGIGYTWEHDLHLLMRRTRTNSTLYGSPSWHREQLCRIHGLGDGS